MRGRKRVFDSVFPSSRLKGLAPTPSATPVLGQTEFGQSFGGPDRFSFSSSPVEASDAYPEQVIWDRAWHTATSFLTLPGLDFLQLAREQLDSFAARYSKVSKNTLESIQYVASKRAEQSPGQKSDRENLMDWYSDHVQRHFLAYSKPSILQVSSVHLHRPLLTYSSSFTVRMQVER
jgi:anaphase-promoting complex subunit 2